MRLRLAAGTAASQHGSYTSVPRLLIRNGLQGNTLPTGYDIYAALSAHGLIPQPVSGVRCADQWKRGR